MQNEDTIIMIKNALLSGDAVASEVLSCLNSLIVTDADPIVGRGDAIEAYSVLRDSRARLPRDESGKRVLSGDAGDKLRERLARVLFHIPLDNLRRRETRVLERDPAASAAPDEERPARTPEPRKPAAETGGRSAPALPVHSVECYERPDKRAFDGYVGNGAAVRTVTAQADGAEKRGEAMRMMLVRGPSGCGKTELCRRLSRYIVRPFVRVAANVLKTGDDVNALLGAVPNGATVFIDEAHVLGEKAGAQIYDVSNRGFTDERGKTKDLFLVFATNLSARLPAALPSRCLTIRLNDYDKRELSEIARLTARSMNVDADDAACGAIADRCHGIARYAVAYTRDIVIETTANKDLCERIAATDVEAFFAGRGIDALGLGEEHRNYLKQLRALGFASASSLAAALGENDASELLGTVEPLLLRHGLISISSRGRSLTDKGRRYIGEEV